MPDITSSPSTQSQTPIKNNVGEVNYSEPPLIINSGSKSSGNTKSKLLAGFVVVLFFLISIPLAVYLAQQRQDIRQRAAVSGEPAVILGKVVDPFSSQYASCPDQRYVFGDNCGNDTCHGQPNYSITWNQEGNSNSIGNNQCWEGSPRYTFESTNNPVGNESGVDTSVSISAQGNVNLVSWWARTTDGDNNLMPGTEQSGEFTSQGPNQTINLKIYKKDNFTWNHVWFLASGTTAPQIAQCNQTCNSNGYTCASGLTCHNTDPTLAGSEKCRNSACLDDTDCACSPTITYDCQCTTVKVYRAGALIEPSQIKINDTLKFVGYGWTEDTADPIDQLRFTVKLNGTTIESKDVAATRDASQDSGIRKYYKGELANYEISSAGNYTVEVLVHTTKNGWIGK